MKNPRDEVIESTSISFKKEKLEFIVEELSSKNDLFSLALTIVEEKNKITQKMGKKILIHENNILKNIFIVNYSRVKTPLKKQD